MYVGVFSHSVTLLNLLHRLLRFEYVEVKGHFHITKLQRYTCDL